MIWLLALAVFAATAALDVAWVHCVTAVRDDRALAAGAWSAATCAIGLVALAGVLRCSAWLAIPDVLGAFTGAALGVRIRRTRC